MKIRWIVAASAALLLLTNAPLRGQTALATDAAGPHLTRAELQSLLARVEETAAGNGGERAMQEAALIRQRLEEGDFRVGDRILLSVDGQTQLSDTFNVVDGRKIVLPMFGDVQLAGVLRSELQPHLAAYIGRFIREPKVHARSLIRLEILGLVNRPGFYMVPSDLVLSDALMVAGGPDRNARIDRIKISRGKELLWEGDRLREAMINGLTLDQLGVRAGDGIEVPANRGKLETFRSVGMVIGSLVSFVFLAERLGAF